MVRPGYSRSTDIGDRGAQSRRAVEIVGQVVEGREVSPEAMTEAGSVLVDTLWSGRASDLPTAQDALAVLIPEMGEPDDQAQILGEVVAVGENGGRVLDGLASGNGGEISVAGLSLDELQMLRNGLARSPRERLAMITGLLPTDVPDRSPAPARDSMRREAVLNRRPGVEDVVRQGESPEGDGPDGERPSPANELRDGAPDGPAAVLADPYASPPLRVQAALLLGPAAVGPLTQMLRSDDSDQKEVAFAALSELGSQEGLDRQIHDQMKVLETIPQTRSVAEHIRRGIAGGAAMSGNPRHLVDQTKVGDGWLGRAIASCDRPGILRAAFGRELYAIPLVLRRLAAARSGRTKSNPQLEG